MKSQFVSLFFQIKKKKLFHEKKYLSQLTTQKIAQLLFLKTTIRRYDAMQVFSVYFPFYQIVYF